MADREPGYVLNNRKKLRWPAAAAPAAAAFFTGAGGLIDVFILAGMQQGHLGVPMLLADIGIGYWQGWLIGRFLEAQAAAPRTSGQNFLYILGRGTLTGLLIGLLNGSFLMAGNGISAEEGLFLFAFTVGIGLAIGAILGFLLGLIGSLYLNNLEPPPGGGPVQ